MATIRCGALLSDPTLAPLWSHLVSLFLHLEWLNIAKYARKWAILGYFGLFWGQIALFSRDFRPFGRFFSSFFKMHFEMHFVYLNGFLLYFCKSCGFVAIHFINLEIYFAMQMLDFEIHL